MNMHITVVVVRGQLYEFYVCVRQKAARLSESCVVVALSAPRVVQNIAPQRSTSLFSERAGNVLRSTDIERVNISIIRGYTHVTIPCL
jgi:hypothetical protein